jgi:DNA-binding beta-propeller fold protein YncE
MVRTVAGKGASGSLSAPGGIALDTSGDLFIADANHCRVVVVPVKSGTMYGLHEQARHAFTLVGGPCDGSLDHPTGIAVDRQGDVYIAEATGERVQVVRPSGSRSPVTIAGTGRAGFSGEGLPAVHSALNQPTGIAVDGAGDLFIADTADCRVRVVPSTSGTSFGQMMVAHHLYTVAGIGVCGSADRTGPGGLAQLWDPVAVAVDSFDDLYIADRGDQSVLMEPFRSGVYYGTVIGAGDLAVIVGTGSNGPYLQDGLSATGVAAELNDPEGVAVGATGNLFIADGNMHAIRVVPRSTALVLGRAMHGGSLYTLAGALPITTSAGLGNGTQWVLTHVGVPVGIAVSPTGNVLFSDRITNVVREIG